MPTQNYQKTGTLDLYSWRQTSYTETYKGIDSSETSYTHKQTMYFIFWYIHPQSSGNLHLGNHTHKHSRDLTLWDTHPQTEQSLYPATCTPRMDQRAPSPRKHNWKSSEIYQPGKYIHRDLRDCVYWEIYPQTCQRAHALAHISPRDQRANILGHKTKNRSQTSYPWPASRREISHPEIYNDKQIRDLRAWDIYP